MKAKHKQDLKPQLSSPNALPVLNHLVASEQSRFQDAKKCISVTMKRLILTQSNLAESFVNRLLFDVKSLQILLDSIPSNDQLGYLPGDENIVHKRKGLKRLQYDALKKPDGKPEDEKVEIRTWTGVNLVSLDLSDDLKMLFVEVPDPSATPSIAAAPTPNPAPTPKNAKAPPKGASSTPTPAIAASPVEPAAPVPPPYSLFGGSKVSENSSCKLMPSSRLLFKSRNQIFEHSVAKYHKQQRQLYQTYSDLLKNEEIWYENWNKMVNYLKQQQL